MRLPKAATPGTRSQIKNQSIECWALLFLGSAFTLFQLISTFHQSLWLDETISAVIAARPWSEMLSFIAKFHSQVPPLSYYLQSMFTGIFGSHEFILRLPSCIATLLATYSYFRFIRTLGGSTNASAFCSLLLLGSSEVSHQLSNARPYGIQLFFAIELLRLSANQLIHQTPRSLLPQTALLILGLYTHFFFALLLPIHLCFLLIFGSRKHLKDFFLMWTLASLSLLPYGLVILRLVSVSSSLNFLPDPISWYTILILHGYPLLIFLALALESVVLQKFLPQQKQSNILSFPSKLMRTLLFLAVSTILPATVLHLAWDLAGLSVVLPRYFIFSEIGLAGFLGLAFEIFSHAQLKLAGRTLLLILLFASHFGSKPETSREDWSCVQSHINELTSQFQSPSEVFLQTHLVEMCDLNRLQDPEWEIYRSSPFQYYTLDSARIISLPCDLTTEQRRNAALTLLRNFTSPIVFTVLRSPNESEGKFLGRMVTSVGLKQLGEKQLCGSIEIIAYTPSSTEGSIR